MSRKAASSLESYVCDDCKTTKQFCNICRKPYEANVYVPDHPAVCYLSSSIISVYFDCFVLTADRIYNANPVPNGFTLYVLQRTTTMRSMCLANGRVKVAGINIHI